MLTDITTEYLDAVLENNAAMHKQITELQNTIAELRNEVLSLKCEKSSLEFNAKCDALLIHNWKSGYYDILKREYGIEAPTYA